MASFEGASRIPPSQPAALYRTCPSGNSSCWEPSTARTTANRAPSADQSTAVMFCPTTWDAPPLIGTRESVPPEIFMMPLVRSRANSPRRDIAPSVRSEKPSDLASGLAGFVMKIWRGSRSH